jgi:hypothetical protein
MTLVGLARDEVLSMLRKVGLLGPSEQLPALEPSAPPGLPPAPQQVAAGGQSKSPEAPPDPEEWLLRVRAKFAQVPRKQRSAWVRDQAFPRMQDELKDKAPWDSPESLKRAMYSGRRKKI